MAIMKSNNLRVSKLGSNCSPQSRDCVWSEDDEEDEINICCTASDSDTESDSECDVDSGAGSDDFDLSELGEVGAEFCQIGSHNFSAPFDLYNLPDLCEILSLDTWNNCLTEDERFSLAEYLPDMDQETFIRTLKELFSGENLNFGSPLSELFFRLKGGLCEPRVALYQQGLNFLEKRKHYHSLHKYQNSMVSSLMQMKDVWDSHAGFGIEERLQLLSVMKKKKQKGLPFMEAHGSGSETDLSLRKELGNGWANKKTKDFPVSSKKVNRGLYSSKPPTALDPVRYMKTNPKGVLKVAKPKAYSNNLTYAELDFPKTKFRAPSSECGLPQQGRAVEYDVGGVSHFNPRIIDGRFDGDGEEDARQAYGMRPTNHHRERVKMLKPGKKRRLAEDYLNYTYCAKNKYSYSLDNSLNGKQSMIIDDDGFDFGHGEGSRKSEQTEHVKRKKDKWSNSVKVTGNRSDLSRTKPSQHGYMVADDLTGDPYDPAVRNRKWKSVDDFKPSMMASEPKSRVYESFSSQLSNSYFPSSQKTKKGREKIAKKSSHNGGRRYNEQFGFNPSEETELDSSEQVSDNVDFNLTSKKLKSKLGHDLMKASKLHRKDNNKAVEELQRLPEIEIFTSKGKQKGRNNEFHYNLNDNSGERSFHPSADLQVDGNGLQNLGNVSEGHDEYTERPSQALAKPISNKKRKLKVELGYSSPHSSFMEVDNMEGMDNLLDGAVHAKRRGKKIESVDRGINEFDECEDASASLIACNSVPRKRKTKKDPGFLDNMDETNHPQSKSQWGQKDTGSAKKKGKKKGDNEALPVASLALDVNAPKVQPGDIEQDTKPQKKTYTLITPSVHTGFSFSVVHLLSAVRIAMTASTSEDSVERGELEQKPRVEYADGLVSDNYVQATADTPEQSGASSLPPLAIQEIVNRVKLNPCDPCILETQEPLLDLVRGVLRIFCSKTAPLGAKGWKALVSYDKGTKSWTWVGPVISASPVNDPVEETSPTAWGIPHKMLVKLVDAFANWLKNGQETLQQIGSLPDPPLMFMPHVEDKERFRDLRAQKSLTTISPSADEVKEYFRKEEYLRYMVPDRAFSYTAIDGKKSIVAPLRRCGGKPTSKARDHFMLKPDRPPHVTILCLVRDSASRLPGSIGTRADVCTLIRDSQYVMEDVSDAQINQVVSGALDRLHYERDPCVQFDSERKLWVYLHKDREEEDFEDDGTSSTKKWKRPRKEATDQNESCPVNDLAAHGGDSLSHGPGGDYDLGPDLISDPSIYEQDKAELVYHNLQPSMESMEPFINLSTGGIRQSHPMGWEVLETNHLSENKLLCQENSTNQDYDGEGFGRDGSVRALGTGII